MDIKTFCYYFIVFWFLRNYCSFVYIFFIYDTLGYLVLVFSNLMLTSVENYNLSYAYAINTHIFKSHGMKMLKKNCP